MKLLITDWIILSIYFLFIFCIGFYFARKATDSQQYFLAGRKTRWFAIGPSIFAANISSEHFIGLAGCGAAAGLAVGAYEWVAAFCLFTLAWVFVSFYLKSEVFTMPEFLERRFNPQCRWYLTSISILAYIFTKISVSLFAGAILLKFVIGWDYLTSAIILVVATGIYTISGGLSAVIYADMIQFVILITGSIIITVIGLDKVGGFQELRNILPADFFHMVKPASDQVYPWTGTTIGIFILGVWYWCTDQYIVQKVLSARNINHAKLGINFTAAFKILPVFVLVLPGLIARALWPNELIINPDQAYPLLITRLLPAGLTGLMIAALLAALISSLASVFNSCSTLITMDIYRKIKSKVTEKELVLAGRIFTGLIVIIGVLWIPLIRFMSNQIYQYLQSVQAYISPPIATVFLFGIFWKRATGKAAFITLISGGVLGAFRFILDILQKAGNVNLGIFESLTQIAFLNYSIILFLFCSIVMVVVSYYTEKSKLKNINGLTFDKFSFDKKAFMSAWNIVHLTMTLLISGIIIGLWIYFA